MNSKLTHKNNNFNNNLIGKYNVVSQIDYI